VFPVSCRSSHALLSAGTSFFCSSGKVCFSLFKGLISEFSCPRVPRFFPFSLSHTLFLHEPTFCPNPFLSDVKSSDRDSDQVSPPFFPRVLFFLPPPSLRAFSTRVTVGECRGCRPSLLVRGLFLTISSAFPGMIAPRSDRVFSVVRLRLVHNCTYALE